MHRVVFFFFFLSGFSSLVFEVIWARMLQQVFGTTSFAISTLLTAFMAGLALGSYVGGKLAHRLGDQLRLYGILEGSIGLYALLVPVMLGTFPSLYGLLFEHFLEDFYLFSLLRFLAVFAILVVPTTMMGATLPLMSQWIARREELFQGSIGLLYGANSFGACLGCLLAGFALLPALGLAATNQVFAAVNVALAVIVLLTARSLEKTGPPEKTPPPQEGLDRANIAGRSTSSVSLPRWAIALTLVVFAVTGVVAMSYQVLWTRAYLITLGSSTYSFTLVLTAVLVGIALGSALLSPFLKYIRRPLFWFALLQFGVASTAALSFFTLNRVPYWLFERIREPTTTAAEIYFFQFGLVALVVTIPSMLQGMSFPLVIRAVTGKASTTGADVGRAYAFNTTGAIIGSFAAGFILMPWLGLQNAIAAMIGLNALAALTLAGADLKLHSTGRRFAAFVAAGAASLGIYLAAPSLDEARMTSGIFRAQMARDVFSERSFERYDPEILYYEDGLTATTSVERQGDTITLRANGKPEASDGADMETQVMVGLLPLIIRAAYDDVEPGGEEVAMIGFGSGVTAGASLQWPLAALEVVEIERTMVEASRFFEHVNNRPLDDERLHLIESDGRNYVEYSPKTFDVIISEPSNPWIAGVSSLFTVEFFERARGKLNPDGVYAQWVQLYEMHPDNVRTVFETFRSVFPHVQAFSSKPKSTDIILIGSDRPIPLPPRGYAEAWEIDSVRAELQHVGVTSAHDILGLLFMNQAQLAEFANGATLNTDDNGYLEFRAPEDVWFYEEGQKFFANWYFRVPDYGDPRQHLDDWPDGPQWTEERVAALTRAIWIAGKQELAAELLNDAGYAYQGRPFDDTPHIDNLSAVLEAGELSILEEITHHWPDSDSSIAQNLHQLKDSPYRRAVLDRLHQERPHDGDGYDGEVGLFHLALLVLERQNRLALRQAQRLEESFGDEPAFQLLYGHALERRRRYSQAFEAYLAFQQKTPQ